MARYHDEMFEFLLDKATVSAFSGDGVDCLRIVPTIWKDGFVPFKKVMIDADSEIVPNYPVAAMYYATAHRRGNVEGAPEGLIRVCLSAQGQLCALLEGPMVSHPNQHTLGFKEVLNEWNYPGLKDVVFQPMTVDVGKAALSLGRALLHKEVVIDGLNKADSSAVEASRIRMRQMQGGYAASDLPMNEAKVKVRLRAPG